MSFVGNQMQSLLWNSKWKHQHTKISGYRFIQKWMKASQRRKQLTTKYTILKLVTTFVSFNIFFPLQGFHSLLDKNLI